MRNRPLPTRRPVLEALEERGLLSALGLPWPDAGHLTLSFAPDGTLNSGARSALYQTLGISSTTASWQTTVLKAFQSWAVLSNINIGLVADNAAPAGQPGPPQGKTGQGDIRLSARPLDPTTLALTTPFDLLGNWSGNVVLNSDNRFGDGSAGTQDLFNAVLHEAGHTLGLDDNPADPASVMYPVDTAGRLGPSAADAATLRAYYGNREPDAYERQGGNDSCWTSTRLAFLSTPADLAGNGAAVAVAEADVTTASDRDTYVFSTPAKTDGGYTVTVRASGLSLLTPRLTVFDALGQSVATVVTTDPLHNDLSVTLPASLPGGTFYARVEGGQAGVFGVGSYRIAVGKPALTSLAAAPGQIDQGAAADKCRNDTIGRAAVLESDADGDDLRWS
jgi:hypothetical protein